MARPEPRWLGEEHIRTAWSIVIDLYKNNLKRGKVGVPEECQLLEYAREQWAAAYAEENV